MTGVDPLADFRGGMDVFVRWAVEHPAYSALMFWRPVPGFVPSERAYAPAVVLDEEGRAEVVRLRDAGILLARLLRIPVPALLGPLAVAAAADLSGLSGGADVPALLDAAAFVLIGLAVGLNFDRGSVRTIGRALPLALAVIVGVIVASAGLGVALSAATGASQLDAYLATTPGRLFAVLATATDGGADATFVLAVQVLRLFVVLGTAPLVARALRGST